MSYRRGQNSYKINPISLKFAKAIYMGCEVLWTLSLPSQLLALPTHGECPIDAPIEHVCGLLISNSCIKHIFLESIDIQSLSVSLLPEVPKICGQQTRSSPPADTDSGQAQHQHKQQINVIKVNNGWTPNTIIQRSFKCGKFGTRIHIQYQKILVQILNLLLWSYIPIKT